MALLEPSTVRDDDERARAKATRPGPWSLAVPLASALVTLLHAPPAHAQDHAEEVTLTRDPPFDRFCLAPICKAPGAPQPIRPPLALPLTGTGSGSRELGLLEAQLRKKLTDAVQAALEDVRASWNHRATRDVLRAIAAIVAKDESALARSKGLGAAALPITAQVAVDAQISTPSFSYYAIARAAEGPVDAGPSCSGRNFDSSAPVGTLTNLSGTVTLESFPASGGAPTRTPINLATAKDGYAAVAASGGSSTLTLTFTLFDKACGYVRNGVQKNDSTSLNITVRDTALTTKTYDAAVFASVGAFGTKTPATAGANGTCSQNPVSAGGGGTSTGTVTITALSATRVAGSFANLNIPGSATNVSGSFDLPICTPLPNLNPSLCCIP